MATRTRLPGGRFTGKITQWRGKFGWIKANAAVKHPEASKNGGKIFLASEDVETDGLSVGESVSFFIYSDGKGLGAQHVRKGAAGSQQQQAVKFVGKNGVNKGIAKPAAPKLVYAQKALQFKAKTQVKGGLSTTKGLTKVVQQKYVAVPTGAAAKKLQPQSKLPLQLKKQLQPKAKSMPSPEGMQGSGGQAPDKSARTRAHPKRLQGKLTKFRGSVGWIKPEDTIEGITKRGLYMHEVDVQPGHHDKIAEGVSVSFLLYQDEAGAGAEHVMVTQAGAAPKTFMQKVVAKKGQGKVLQPTAKAKAGIKFVAGAKPVQKKVKAKGNKGNKANQGEKEEKGGPDLPRNRVTDLAVSGEVVEWKGSYGWVRANDPIDHELAGKRDGKIYLHSKDVVGGDELSPGQSVEFHVYADKSGLGAEECLSA